MPTDWIKEWLKYEERTGKRPSTLDPDSKNIYAGVLRGANTGRIGYKEFFDARRVKQNPTIDWLLEWEDYVQRTGMRPSQRDPDSKEIYLSVQNGVRSNRPGYREFWDSHRASVNRPDWVQKWRDYEARTGKRPSPRDPDSKRIYSHVKEGASKGYPGYREFWEANRLRRKNIDWLAEWIDYEQRTGKTPSHSDPDSYNIYTGVLRGARRGFPGYKEFFKAHRAEGKQPTDWIKEWKDYTERTGKRPSYTDPASRNIYVGVKSGVSTGRPGYKKFWENHKTVREPVDWIAAWKEYESRTGRAPVRTGAKSGKIYNGVYRGAKQGRPGYKEFWEAHRPGGANNAN